MSEPTPLPDLVERITAIEPVLAAAVGSLVAAKPEHADRAQTAAWNLGGQIYHARRLYQHYTALADQVSGRVNAVLPDTPPDVLLFVSPAAQQLLYEFYAFLSLARISLDELRHLLRFVLAPPKGASLPKSMKDLVRGVTDCPMLVELRGDPLFRHLVDLRDCLVHHKAFVSADRMLVVKDGSDVDLEEILQDGWSRPVTLPLYRVAEGDRIVVNVLLPDRIYSYPTPEDRGSLVFPFTYGKRHNILTQIVEYLRFGAYQVIQSLLLLRDHEEAPYAWEKPPPPPANRRSNRR